MSQDDEGKAPKDMHISSPLQPYNIGVSEYQKLYPKHRELNHFTRRHYLIICLKTSLRR